MELKPEQLLKFGTQNSKLKGRRTATFALPAGYSCPGACECLAKFNLKTRKLEDGPKAKFRCYAATMEAAFGTYRDSVHNNWQKILAAKTREKMADLIDLSLPSKYWKWVRIHSDGDFFNENYFLAWIDVANRNKHTGRRFYAYTKSLEYWVANRHLVPENLIINASRGGKFDYLIEQENLPNSVVVFHPEEAERLGLQIDHDDDLAKDPSVHQFALLLHGQQKAGSEASKAKKRMDAEGIKYSYSKKNGTPKTTKK